MSVLKETTQQNQPEGVPPLSLTGERTLPDVPAENYWYRRHLVVYKWIAERCRGSSASQDGMHSCTQDRSEPCAGR